MNTPTHVLISSAVLARPGETPRNWAVIAGALLPDVYLYGLFVWSKIMGIPEGRLWSRIYWDSPVQLLSALSNSVPLYGALLLAGIIMRGRNVLISVVLVIFSLSALLHTLFDFGFHHSDAHRHFWPLTDWRFHSPLSYWDSAHFGAWVGLFEMGLALILIGVLWRRFSGGYLKIMLILAAASYIAVPAYFNFMLG